MREVRFLSDGESCAATHLPSTYDDFRSSQGRPCVVMAPGLGGTRDSGFAPYAERFVAAGLDVLLFDYRHFGSSSGRPRQLVSVRRQHADYCAAVAHARSLDTVDAARIVLWGFSYSGGHVIALAAADPAIAAVIAVAPGVDGRAILALRVRRDGVTSVVHPALHGLRDLGRALLRREAHTIPIAGRPGTAAAITAPGALEQITAKAGPTWRNEITARSVLGGYRPGLRAADLPCPVLVQVGEHDEMAPPEPAERAAQRATGRAEVRRYPFGHYDVFADGARERLAADQVRFLRRHLATDRTDARQESRA